MVYNIEKKQDRTMKQGLLAFGPEMLREQHFRSPASAPSAIAVAACRWRCQHQNTVHEHDGASQEV